MWAGPLRRPRISTGVTRLQPGVSGRARPRRHPRISVGTSPLSSPRVTTRIRALRHTRVSTGITRLQPGVGQRTASRPHPRISMGTSPLPHPRIGRGTTPLRHPRVGTGITRLQPGIGRRAVPRPASRVGIGATLLRQTRVGTGITRLQPRVGRRTWPWAGEGAGSWIGGGPPAVTGAAAIIIGGRAPPGPSGFLRTSLSHASPLRPAERNPSWPSGSKSLHHAASAGGAATWSAMAVLSALVGAWSRPNRSGACLSLCVRERARIVVGTGMLCARPFRVQEQAVPGVGKA